MYVLYELYNMNEYLLLFLLLGKIFLREVVRFLSENLSLL